MKIMFIQNKKWLSKYILDNPIIIWKYIIHYANICKYLQSLTENIVKLEPSKSWTTFLRWAFPSSATQGTKPESYWAPKGYSGSDIVCSLSMYYPFFIIIKQPEYSDYYFLFYYWKSIICAFKIFMKIC